MSDNTGIWLPEAVLSLADLTPIEKTKFQQDKKRRKSERYQIKKHRRLNPACQNCGLAPKLIIDGGYSYTSNYPTIHHLKPISEGGSWKDGLMTLCEKCHNDVHTVDGKFSYRHINEDLTAIYRQKVAAP